jgi:hypothetical protein
VAPGAPSGLGMKIPKRSMHILLKGVTDTADDAWDQKPGKPGAQPLRYAFATG